MKKLTGIKINSMKKLLIIILLFPGFLNSQGLGDKYAIETLKEGVELYENNKYHISLTYYNVVIGMYPDFAEAYFYRGIWNANFERHIENKCK